MKRPAFMFYPGDWRKDPALRVCSVAARGLWMDVLCLMHESDQYGHLSVNGVGISAEQLARLVGESLPVVRKLLAELESHNVFSRNDQGVIYSRRMVADEQRRQFQAREGKKGGSPSLGVEYNRPGHIYVMRRSSDGAVKIGISATPTKRLYRVRQQFPSCVVDLVATSTVDDMGTTEAALHQRYKENAIGGAGEWFALDEPELNDLLSHLKVIDKANAKVKGKGKGKVEAPPSVAVAVAGSEQQEPSPLIAAGSGEPERAVTWLTPYADAWQAQYEGPMPVEQNVQALRWLEGKYGAAETLRRWVILLGGTLARFASAAKLKSGWGDYAAPPAIVVTRNGVNTPAQAHAAVLWNRYKSANLLTKWERPEYERIGAELVAKGDYPSVDDFLAELRQTKPWTLADARTDGWAINEIANRLALAHAGAA